MTIIAVIYILQRTNALIYNIDSVTNTDLSPPPVSGLGSLSGSFDLTGGILSSVNLTTTANTGGIESAGIFYGFTYTSGTYAGINAVFLAGSTPGSSGRSTLTFDNAGNIISAYEEQFVYRCSPRGGCTLDATANRNVQGLSIGPVAVPEPSTYMMIPGFLMLAGLAAAKRRKAPV